MAGNIFEGGNNTFADFIGVDTEQGQPEELESQETEDFEAEDDLPTVEQLSQELNPPLRAEAKHIPSLALNENAKLISDFNELKATVRDMSTSLSAATKAINELHEMVQSAWAELPENPEPEHLPEDLEGYVPSKKGTPGRPAKQKPKITVAKKPKVEPPKAPKADKNKKIKVPAKKAVPAKTKAVKKKANKKR